MGHLLGSENQCLVTSESIPGSPAALDGVRNRLVMSHLVASNPNKMVTKYTYNESVQPPAGLEPATQRLKALRSTDSKTVEKVVSDIKLNKSCMLLSQAVTDRCAGLEPRLQA